MTKNISDKGLTELLHLKKKLDENVIEHGPTKMKEGCCCGSKDPSRTYYESNRDKLGGTPQHIVGGKFKREFMLR
jgi:hypothetical protein